MTKVLIILLGSIGDVTRGLAVANALQSTKQFSVSWLVEPKSLEILRTSPDVNDIIVFERKQGMRAFFKALRQIRTQHFDVVLDMQRHLKSGLFSKLSGVKRRIGFNPKNTKEFNHIFNTEFIPEWSEEGEDRSSKLTAYLSFLPLLGLPIPSSPSWNFDNHHGDSLSEFLDINDSKRRIGIVLSSSWESKNWMGNAELCQAILEKRAEIIILIGDSSCVEQAEKLRSLNPARIISTVGKISLSGLVAIVKRCSVIVGPDSGPGHIAGALKVPYIGIFGPTDPVLTAPYGSEGLALHADLGCSPCYRRRCPGLGKLCLRLITPNAVLNRLAHVLQ